MSGLHVVLGGSGGIGAAVVRALAADGVEVRAVGRSATGPVPDVVHRRVADVSTPEGAAAACEGASVVYHCAQPPYHRWAQELLPLNRVVEEAVGREGAKLVVADNLYMYGPVSVPITEGSPQEPASRKGRVRKMSADAFLAAHAAGRLRVAIGRASDYYGPNGTNSVAGEAVFGAAVAGKTVRWPADADQPRSFSYLPDLARALVTLGQHDAADGRAWIVPSAPPVTARSLVSLIEQELGHPLRLVVTSRAAMRVAGVFIRPARELPDIWEQFARPFVADASAFERAFGPVQVTSHELAVRETVDWFRLRHHAGPSAA